MGPIPRGEASVTALNGSVRGEAGAWPGLRADVVIGGGTQALTGQREDGGDVEDRGSDVVHEEVRADRLATGGRGNGRARPGRATGRCSRATRGRHGP